MNYYYHHIGDFKKDTAHLTHEERSIYLELLWMYYDQEKPLENNIDRLSRLCRTDANVIDVILSDFFYLQDDVWHHTRVHSELTKMYDKSEKCKMAVEKRWAKDKTIREYSDSNTDGIAPNTQDPIPKTQSIYDYSLFRKFWDEVIPTTRKYAENKCKAKWKAHDLNKEAEKIFAWYESMKKTEEWNLGMIPAPEVVINQRRWESGIPMSKNKQKKYDWEDAK